MGFGQRKKNKDNRSEVNYNPNVSFEEDWSIREITTVIGIIAGVALVPGLMSARAWAQTMFPDVPADYWAQPFIEKLAQEGIVEGYPDGTFRPEESIDRDEYAAIIGQSFDMDAEKTLASASTLSDVPEDYWAAPAIEEAYEMGFMDLPEANEFEPQTELSRAAAITALVQGLELSEATPTAATTVVPTEEPAAQAQATQPQTQQQQRGTPFHLAIPMASTQIMQIFAPPPAQAASPQQIETVPQTTEPAISSAPTSEYLSQYYADADQIPDYARDEIELATRLGLVVNYPDVELLNPTQPISRGGATALVHQALVYQNRLDPLPETSPGSPYLVPEEPGTEN